MSRRCVGLVFTEKEVTSFSQRLFAKAANCMAVAIYFGELMGTIDSSLPSQ